MPLSLVDYVNGQRLERLVPGDLAGDKFGQPVLAGRLRDVGSNGPRHPYGRLPVAANSVNSRLSAL